MTLRTKEAWFNTQRSKDGSREFASCTAWANFDGENVVNIRDSMNVSSITDNGSGNYNINFEQAMDNSDYCFSGSTSASLTTAKTLQGATYLTTSLQLYVIYANETSVGLADYPVVSISFFGGVA